MLRWLGPSPGTSGHKLICHPRGHQPPPTSGVSPSSQPQADTGHVEPIDAGRPTWTQGSVPSWPVPRSGALLLRDGVSSSRIATPQQLDHQGRVDPARRGPRTAQHDHRPPNVSGPARCHGSPPERRAAGPPAVAGSSRIARSGTPNSTAATTAAARSNSTNPSSRCARSLAAPRERRKGNRRCGSQLHQLLRQPGGSQLVAHRAHSTPPARQVDAARRARRTGREPRRSSPTRSHRRDRPRRPAPARSRTR